MRTTIREIRVFLVPAGKKAARSAYKKLAKLLEAHRDLHLSVYCGPKRYDGKWSLVLIGETASLSRYQEQIQHRLSEVSAQLIKVPPDSLAPLVENYLATQAEMLLAQETFLEKHHH